MVTTTYAKLADGSWGLEVVVAVAAGDAGTGRKKNDEEKRETVGRVVHAGEGDSLCTIAAKPAGGRNPGRPGKWMVLSDCDGTCVRVSVSEVSRADAEACAADRSGLRRLLFRPSGSSAAAPDAGGLHAEDPPVFDEYGQDGCTPAADPWPRPGDVLATFGPQWQPQRIAARYLLSARRAALTGRGIIELAVDIPLVFPVDGWTTETPRVRGWYWIQGRDTSEPGVAMVELHR